MKRIHQIYINGTFITPHGTETLELINPATEEPESQVRLADAQDLLIAIDSARKAAPDFSNTSKAERQAYLQRLHDSVIERLEDLQTITIKEYGANVSRALWSNRLAAESFLQFKEVLDTFEFEKTVGKSKVVLEPVGVTAILTAWNSNSGSICVKLAAAIAAGCTTIIKPSEFSAAQTQILTECFHKAGLPPGVINVLNGRGEVLGDIISKHPDIARITFTGSTVVGKIIARNALDTMKRITLELSGKSPNIILDDADLDKALPLAVNACFMNNGQACIAGTRLIVPEKLLPEIRQRIIKIVEKIEVGEPGNKTTDIGPLASQKQFDRIQNYIKSGIEEGAELLIGGEGRPDGLKKGYYVRPTVFASVTEDMTIAREEIFGPVLSILTYNNEEDAVRMANNTTFGLHAYISSSNLERANKIARQLQSGRVVINAITHDPLTPFGGFKQSGIGREGGIYGLEAQLEPKAILY